MTRKEIRVIFSVIIYIHSEIKELQSKVELALQVLLYPPTLVR